MKVCLNCNKELRDDAKFCDNCGTPVSEEIAEEVTPVQQETEMLQETEAQTEVAKQTVSATETILSPVSKAAAMLKQALSKKVILFGAIGVAAVAVIAIIIALIAGGKDSQDNYLLYLKDKEIFYSDLGKDLNAWQLTSHLIDTDDVEASSLGNFGYSFGMLTHMSDDGKLLFFPDKIDTKDDGFNLYYRDITDKDTEAVKIDSDVISYSVNKSAKVVTYLKGDEGSLYQYTLKTDSKDKIASDVAGFEASDDGNKISFIDSEGSIYLRYMDRDDKEKIASDVEELVHLTADFKTVYYRKENALYKQTEGEDRVKITSDVADVLKVYDSGEIYFTKSNIRELSLIDYVDDDMKDADAALTAPTRPASPSWWDYDTTEEYNKAYDEYKKAYEKYEDAYEAYFAKQQRDSIREALEDEVIEHTEYALYYFDGEETTTITESFIKNYSGYSVASDAAVIVYTSAKKGSTEKVKLSQLSGAYEVANKVRESLSAGEEKNVAIKGDATEIDHKDANAFRINSTGTLIYFMDNIPEEKEHGELYSIEIKGNKVGEAELYDEDVYTFNYFLSDDKFVYFKDFDGSDNGDMYINKECIDYDVRVWTISYYNDEDSIIYYTDWNSEKKYGTLKFWDGKKATKVADEVHSQYVLPDDRILYLYDYSTQYYKGELRIWDDGKTEKVDDDVICIIPAYEGRLKGMSNYQ